MRPEKKALQKENKKYEWNKTKNRKLAGMLKKGFMFHLVTVLSSNTVLAAEWYRLDSSLCNCQAEGFKVGFKQVFQSDRQILVLKRNIDCKASHSQVDADHMVEHSSQFEGSKCYPMLSISRVGFCLFYITKRIIRRRLKTNILFSDNHEFVMAAWKS